MKNHDDDKPTPPEPDIPSHYRGGLPEEAYRAGYNAGLNCAMVRHAAIQAATEQLFDCLRDPVGDFIKKGLSNPVVRERMLENGKRALRRFSRHLEVQTALDKAEKKR